MSAYYYGPQHHQPSSSSSHATSSHNHHGGRSRRAPRLSSSQNSHRQFRGVRSMKELTEAPAVSVFRTRFEAGRSFDLDDDLEFCPGLLTEDDVSHHKQTSLTFVWNNVSSIPDPILMPRHLHSYNRSILHLPTALLSRAARRTRLRYNIKSNPPSKSRQTSLSLQLPIIIRTTRRPVFNHTLVITR